MSVPPAPTSGSQARRLALPAALALALALALAGCGGSSTPGVAHVGTTSAFSPAGGSGGGTPESGESVATAQRKLVKFAQCMRAHGEPQFPEPTEGAIRIQSRNGSGPNPESPQWKAAEKACSKYAPANVAPSPAQQKAHQEQALKFSACMRSHGVPNFPDPKFSGGGNVEMNMSGVNAGSPQVQAAAKACQGDSLLGKAIAKGGLPSGPAAPGGGAQSSSGATAVAP
jgi:hypothetical protein